MIAISTRGRYSLRILISMSLKPQGHVFAKYEIAEAEGLTCAYVQQLMITLKAGRFVNSHRGKVGGFTLARPADSITVAEVLDATEGEIALSPCLGNERCEREPRCPVRPMWLGAARMLDEYFEGITVAQLAAGGPDSDYLLGK
jgi:Rrf2 family transcriptional regulator, iron-sulfur cluster assembly transcription factor